MTSTVEELVERGVLSWLDFELADTLAALVGERSAEVRLGVAFASWAVQRGHTCVELPELETRTWHDEAGELEQGIALPPTRAWLAALGASLLVQSPDRMEQEPRPLVLDAAGRLYLARYHQYEQRLARALRARAEAMVEDVDGALLAQDLERLFPSTSPGIELQRRAALVAALRRLCIISGGPGTGKTFTVAKILMLVQGQALARRVAPKRILLVAPTGKAAQRLGESIRQNLAGVPEPLASLIPTEASTLHRALGYQPRTPTRFRHDRDRPLPADVVVVDEASMVDLALMAKLLDALGPEARLILLGDKDQLASVEAGAILGDIYAGGAADGYSRPMVERVLALTGERLPPASARVEPGIHDCMVHLEHVHRFDAGSGIAALARAINAGDADTALALLERSPELELCPLDAGAGAEEALGRLLVDRFAGLHGGAPAEQLARLQRFRILCAHRRGRFGVESMNQLAEDRLRRHWRADTRGGWYDGRPVMVTSNDYQLALFNGDVGVVARFEDGLRACFPGGAAGAVRRFVPAQLPQHETAYAMSVHKAQGSELEEVALLLPERASPILTRELVYTGVTRAKQRVRIYGTAEVLRHAIATRVQRASGLRDALAELG